MPDILTPDERSALMSTIRSGDTKPEWILRTGLHRMGFRFSLRNKKLPGSPDLVFRKYGAVVFVNGCYWHFHRKGKCRRSTVPKSNTDFWLEKFDVNVKRDRKKVRELKRLGWRVITVWECQLLDQTMETIEKVADWLVEGRRVTLAGRGEVSYPAEAEKEAKRKHLLKVAEGKVRDRIDSYGKKKQRVAIRERFQKREPPEA